MTKFFIDYDKNKNLEAALDMLDLLEEKGKAANGSGRVVGIDADLANGVIAVLNAMGVTVEILPEFGVDCSDTEDKQAWISEIDGLPVLPAVEQPAPRKTTNEERDTWPVCPYCSEHYWPRRKDQTMCAKPECKKAKQREYAKEHAAKKAKTVTVEIREEPPSDSPFEGNQDQVMEDVLTH